MKSLVRDNLFILWNPTIIQFFQVHINGYKLQQFNVSYSLRNTLSGV